MKNTSEKNQKNLDGFYYQRVDQQLQSEQNGFLRPDQQSQQQNFPRSIKKKDNIKQESINETTQQNALFIFILVLIGIVFFQIILPGKLTQQFHPPIVEEPAILLSMQFKNYSASQLYQNYRNQYKNIIETTQKSLQMLIKLKSMRQITNLQLKNNQLHKILSDKNQVTVLIITAPQRKSSLQKTLISFFNKNTYPQIKIKIIVDGQSKNQSLKQLITKYSNITWVFTQSKLGQIAALDFAHKNIKTKYILMSQDNIIYKKPGFIQFALNKYQQNAQQKISKVLLRKLQDIGQQKLTILSTVNAGFTFNTGLYKYTDYLLLKGGYQQYTKNISYGKMAGQQLQQYISKYYIQQQYTMYTPYQPYYQYIQNSTFWNMSIFALNMSQIGNKKIQQIKQQRLKSIYQINKSIKQLQTNRSSYRSSTLYKLVTSIFVETPAKFQNYKGFNLIDLGVSFNRQIGSQLDLFKIQQTSVYKEYIRSKIQANYTAIQAINISMPNKKVQNRVLSNQFKNSTAIRQYINTNYENTNKNKMYSPKLLQNINKQQNDNKLQQIQNYLANKRYNIGQNTQKLGICVFVYGQSLFNQSKYVNLLKSIQKQNYTNYRVILVDQQAQNAQKIKQWDKIKQQFPSLSNKLKITSKPNWRLKKTGNNYLVIKSLCANKQIIVQIGPNSNFIGRQSFNIINSVYKNQQIWMALFVQYKQQGIISLNQVKRLRKQNNTQFLQPFLKTYRYFLNRKIPIQHLMQLQYTQKYGVYQDFLTPRFYKGDIQLFYLYSYMEMSGQNRIAMINDPIHKYQKYINKPIQNCQQLIQQLNVYKAKIKTPLQILQNKESIVRYVKNYEIQQNILKQMKQIFNKYNKCKPLMFDRLKKPPYVAPTSLIISNIKQMLNKRSSKFYKPWPFTGVNNIQNIQQLPFCLFISLQNNNNTQYQQKIIRAILKQNYQNYITIFLGYSISYQRIQQIHKQLNKTNNITIDRIYFQLNNSNVNTYSDYKYLMHKLCVQNSLIMFVNDVLQMNALKTLNNFHQTTPTFLVYAEKFQFTSLFSFYMRIFDFIEIYDNGNNRKYMESTDFVKLQHFLSLAIMQISTKRIIKIYYQDIHQMQKYQPKQQNTQTRQTKRPPIPRPKNQPILTIQPGSQFSKTTLYLKISRDDSPRIQLIHTPYQAVPNLKLSPQQQNPISAYDKSLTQLGKMNTSIQINEVTSLILKLAIQYQNIHYLPKQHILQTLQYKNMYYTYGYQKYQFNQTAYINMDICVVFIAKKQTSKNRLINNLRLVLKQNYTNFRIVYIDNDCSQDISKAAIEQLQNSVLGQNRIVYIKNSKQKSYLYNTLNTAYNICKLEEYQIVINSDQQLIGYYYLDLLNWQYTNNPQLWLIYTSFKTDKQNFGTASRIINMYQYRGYQGRVSTQPFMPRIAAWSIHLIRSIPKQYLEYNGKLLEVFQDVALMHALIQLAAPWHAEYIPLPLYEEMERNNQTQIMKFIQQQTKNTQKSQKYKIYKHILSQEVLENVYPINQRSNLNGNLQNIFKRDQNKQWSIKNIFNKQIDKQMR